MEVGADDVKSVLYPASHRIFMTVLYKQNQKILGRRIFRMKEKKKKKKQDCFIKVLPYFVPRIWLPAHDHVPSGMFSPCCPIRPSPGSLGHQEFPKASG